jgi:hypothetical protein
VDSRYFARHFSERGFRECLVSHITHGVAIATPAASLRTSTSTRTSGGVTTISGNGQLPPLHPARTINENKNSIPKTPFK